MLIQCYLQSVSQNYAVLDSKQGSDLASVGPIQ